MKELLLQLERELFTVGNPVVRRMDDNPNPIGTEFETCKRCHLSLPPDFAALYEWHSGKTLAPEKNDERIQLCSFGSPVCLADAVSLYLLDKSTSRILYPQKLLPFVYVDFYSSPLLINLMKRSKDYGSLFYYHPTVSADTRPYKIYDSPKSWLKTVIKCYQEKVYSVDSDGMFRSNFDREIILSKTLNPQSDYWNLIIEKV